MVSTATIAPIPPQAGDIMRRALKFLHTMGAIGMMGAMACLVVMLSFAPQPSQIAQYAAIRGAMDKITTWIFLPAMALTVIAGLLAIGLNRAFHNAGWAWVKLATGVLIFEWSLAGIQGPMQEEAEQSARVLAGQADLATLAVSLGSDRGSLWVMLAVATANVVLGVWRPKLTNLPD